jgi:hypothetical protein
MRILLNKAASEKLKTRMRVAYRDGHREPALHASRVRAGPLVNDVQQVDLPQAVCNSLRAAPIVSSQHSRSEQNQCVLLCLCL